MRRSIVFTVVSLLILTACSSPEVGSPQPDANQAASTAQAVQPRPNASFRGDLVPDTGVTGWVRFTTSASGEVVDPFVWLDMTYYDCRNGQRLSAAGGIAPIGLSIPVVEGRFEDVDSQQTWLGTFTSDSEATGTVEGNLVRPDCAFGPLTWTALLIGVDDPTDTTLAAGTTSTATASDADAILCTVSERFLERAEQESTRFEGADFWESQRYDAELLVGLVRDDLQADMELNAEAWRKFVLLLSAYDYDSRTMFDVAGVEAYTNIFTPQVIAADQRVQEYITATCSP